MAARPAKSDLEHYLIVEDDRGRKGISLKEASYRIGREKNSDIHLSSQFVSRRHATLNRRVREDGTSYYQIVDGDGEGRTSVNGLLINGRKLESHNLKHGDEIVFGPQVFAIYQLKERDLFPTVPPDDPFDITLIDPGMMMDD
ncbi:FHA domain-containing protein [Lusitaniella coriacea LEGE 07157]|uniref:FHA domain-containing protein n=1 Tax=Lusitaniella coriacea LEGE 07157 TaxID=945747 RepID=A0A8J7B807_9CYAN|nr:FHA domain-containing protein [Lusitaniella coriacea]MBE9114895.1 FHA domain-containing protein [Lusitaniella coriacea LEGE 07157]